MKSKRGLYRGIIIVMMVILSMSVKSYAQAVSDTTKTIKQLIDKSDVIKGQAYYIAESVVDQSLTDEEKNDYIKKINDLFRDVKSLQSEIDSDGNTLNYGSVDSRNLTILAIVVDFYKNFLDEVLIYLRSDDKIEKFKALERLFYDKTVSEQKLIWLQEILDNK